MIQSVKAALVKRGSASARTRMCLGFYGWSRGFRISYDSVISIRKGTSVLRVANGALYMVPYMMKYFDTYFRSFEASDVEGLRVLDFSRPAFHRYIKTKTRFFFPSIPEEEFGEEYTCCYHPGPGENVFDLGANAGATTYWLSKAVGDTGKVFAFEPDECNYQYLLKNIEHHGLRNIVPIRKAIGGSTGAASFHMDGTLSSGFCDVVAYSGVGTVRMVETLTLRDACREVGVVPTFVKMDVEGAEVGIVSESADFLRANPIHFAIDSCHLVGGDMTCFALDKLFAGIGYGVRSSGESGAMFTWATPPPRGVSSAPFDSKPADNAAPAETLEGFLQTESRH
jgi:FkbM family methyltransferase